VVLIILSDLERRDARGLFLPDLHTHNTLVGLPLPQNDQSWHGNTCSGRACFYKVRRPVPITRGVAQSVSNFGDPTIYVHTVRPRTTKFCMITHLEKRHMFSGQCPSAYKGASAIASKFWGPLQCLCRPTNFAWRSNYARENVYRAGSTPQVLGTAYRAKISVDER